MKNIAWSLCFLLGFILLSCDSITRMETPVYTMEIGNPYISGSYISCVVLTSEKYNAAQLGLIASNVRKNTDIKYTDLSIQYKEHASAPTYATTSMNEDSVVTRPKSEKVIQQEQALYAPVTDSPEVTPDEPESRPEAPAKQKRTFDPGGKEVLGRFRDSFSSIYTIYKMDGKYYMDNAFSDGSHNVQELETRTRDGVKTYNVAGDPYEYYEIQNGKLYCYDQDGNLGLVYNPD